MSQHQVEISWQKSGDFAKGQYSRRHEWSFDGGLTVPASASASVVPERFCDPSGVDPEEAFVASLHHDAHEGCFLACSVKTAISVEWA